MNLFGFQIDGYDVGVFLATARVAFVALALGGAALMIRRPGAQTAGRIILGLSIAGHGLAWLATMFPLPNVYGANGSMDRENHVGWANVVALGFSPLRTFQVNHLHFEPVWPLLTAIAAGFNVDRVAQVFQWQPLIAGIALLLTIRFARMRGMSEAPDREIEASLAAMGGLLLMAVPDDFAGPFRNPWALMFLLKPNHALGLVLVPLAALAIARASDWKSRLFAGFVLQLVGWAFVIHMALFVVGLAIFVALSFATKRPDRKRDLVDAGTAVGANLVLVSPYVVMLLVAYPFLKGHAMYSLSPFSERAIDGTLRLGLLFLLSAFGAWRAYQGGSRLGRILASQWLGAQIIWQSFPILGLFGQAREQDEAFYWCRFWIGAFAGVGLYQGLRFVQARAALKEVQRGLVAAATLVLLLPSLVPSWWDPSRMDQYFKAGREPIPDWVAEPTHFIKTTTPENAVFASDWNYARWIAAYGARRVLIAKSLNLPNDYKRRMEVENALFRTGSEELLREGRERYGVEYVLATSNVMAQAPDVTLELLERRPHLETIYDHQWEGKRVMIFKVRQGGRR